MPRRRKLECTTRRRSGVFVASVICVNIGSKSERILRYVSTHLDLFRPSGADHEWY